MRRTIQLQHYTNFLLLPIIPIIIILIVFICKRYNQNNKFLRKPINNSCLFEITWICMFALILILISMPSIKLLKYQTTQKRKAFITIKVIAYQWYWNYEYFFNRTKIHYNSNMLKPSERQKYNKLNKKLYPKLLAVDYELIIPTKKVIKLIITSADVIHAFTVPAFGIKIDAIPGKINDTWIKVEQPGIYYGQCSEFCGKDHAYMPIAIRAISYNKFAKWVNLMNVDKSDAFKNLTCN